MPLADNLAVFYELEEASGTRADATGGGRTLADGSSTTSNPGRVGDAGQFSGGVDYLFRATDAVFNVGDIDFYLCAWAYLDSKPTSSYYSLVSRYGFSDNDVYTLFYSGPSDDRFGFSIASDASNGTTVIHGTVGISTATWYFVEGWHDSVNNLIWVNASTGSTYGTPVSAAWSLGAFGTATPAFIIGAEDHGTGFMDGRIDQVGFWRTRIPSLLQRQQLFNSGNGLSYAQILTQVDTLTLGNYRPITRRPHPWQMGNSR